ncbi:hypothetical protein [Candidatus Uabimicrobium amorphum]|uniref:PEP-CTERM protein-sorting domain-containing protein n=1 Tax=Uabimicrobium amorphum TaxID=2596890 RepID=A0A5S9IPY8_UABAM|nr:hypothetical protein [Candidatus Uabimicrobium amorphum]BBM84535.1 hypothetical protein UABAM_02896 [Candidatus Uabimicrobium amorphum]
MNKKLLYFFILLLSAPVWCESISFTARYIQVDDMGLGYQNGEDVNFEVTFNPNEIIDSDVRQGAGNFFDANGTLRITGSDSGADNFLTGFTIRTSNTSTASFSGFSIQSDSLFENTNIGYAQAVSFVYDFDGSLNLNPDDLIDFFSAISGLPTIGVPQFRLTFGDDLLDLIEPSEAQGAQGITFVNSGPIPEPSTYFIFILGFCILIFRHAKLKYFPPKSLAFS